MQNYVWMATNWTHATKYYRNKSVPRLWMQRWKKYYTSFDAPTARCRRSGKSLSNNSTRKGLRGRCQDISWQHLSCHKDRIQRGDNLWKKIIWLGDQGSNKATTENWHRFDAPGFLGGRVDDSDRKSRSFALRKINEHPAMPDMGHNHGFTVAGIEWDKASKGKRIQRSREWALVRNNQMVCRSP